MVSSIMGANKTKAADFIKMGLTAPEKKLWKALEGGTLCRFYLSAPDEDRTFRGDVFVNPDLENSALKNSAVKNRACQHAPSVINFIL